MGDKGERTRKHILEMAFQLFSAQGYTSVSMQDICTACGLSKGGLYRYYDSKDGVFLDLLQQLQAEEDDAEKQAMVSGLPACAVLEAFFERTRAGLTAAAPNLNIALYEFCIAHRNDRGPELLQKQYERGRKLLLRLIEYGCKSGEFAAERPEDAADTILLLFEGLKMTNEVMPLEAPVTDRVFRQVRSMLGAAAPEAGRGKEAAAARIF